ncbi:MAG: hypothetical protein AAGA75_26125 [Cyanobacteria bacterium P01_E01_bin.6]
MAKAKPFEEKYPAMAYFVATTGWIEIGDHEVVASFVRAYDQGGTVYEGESSYSTMEDALQDLEKGIKIYLDEIGIEYE